MRTERKKPEITLPGFVDIIFLLLIFSMATMSFTSGKQQVDDPGKERFLPVVPKSYSESPDEYLNNLLIIITYRNPENISGPEPDRSKEVIILRPAFNQVVPVTIRSALQQARSDSTSIRPLPVDLSGDNFYTSAACSLITAGIDEYASRLAPGDKNNTIEIRAVKDTEFRIINHIMTQASRSADLIHRLNLHTLAGQ